LSLDLTEVFRPWVLVALAVALAPFALVVADRLRRAFEEARPAA
jgi:hypothetical protein